MAGKSLASLKSKARRSLSGENGSLTLEATIVLPWIMLLTFLLILFAVFVLNRSTHYYSLSVAAARTAFAWPHSSASLKTGGYPEGGYDGLYWRLKDDALLANLFGWETGDNGDAIAAVGAGAFTGSGNALAESKLRHAAAALPAGIEGNMTYRNRIALREVTIRASGKFAPNPLRRLWPSFDHEAAATVSAVVNEPAEWVRTFQLARYYLARIQRDSDYAERLRRQAAKMPGDEG